MGGLRVARSVENGITGQLGPYDSNRPVGKKWMHHLTSNKWSSEDPEDLARSDDLGNWGGRSTNTVSK